MNEPLAVDNTTGTKFLLTRSFGEWSLHFKRLTTQGTPVELSIPMSPTQSEELAHDGSPGKEKVEIERKWLVDRDVALKHISQDGVVGYGVTQGYVIIADGFELRVRQKQKHGADKATYTLTIKGAGDIVRGEKEIEITRLNYQALMDLFVDGRIVDKDRFVAPRVLDGAEIDLYKRAGPQMPEVGEKYLAIATAEKESRSEDEANNLEAPDWFHHDVTKVKAMKNHVTPVDTTGAPGSRVRTTPQPLPETAQAPYHHQRTLQGPQQRVQGVA